MKLTCTISQVKEENTRRVFVMDEVNSLLQPHRAKLFLALVQGTFVPAFKTHVCIFLWASFRSATVSHLPGRITHRQWGRRA